MKRTMSLSIQIKSCQIESDHSPLLTCTNKKYKKYEDDDVNISIKEAESNFGQLMVFSPGQLMESWEQLQDLWVNSVELR